MFVSAVALWEVEVKRAAGKLDAPPDLLHESRVAGLEVLSLAPEHAIRAGRLPLLHRDPFDRAIVATAQVERLTLLTGDVKLAQYDVPVLDARR